MESNRPDEISGASGTYAFVEESDSVFLFCSGDGLILKDFKNSSMRKFSNQPHNRNSLSDNAVLGILKDTSDTYHIIPFSKVPIHIFLSASDCLLGVP